MLHLGIVIRILRLPEIVLGERTAIRYYQRWSHTHPRQRDGLDQVIIQGINGNSMFMTRIAIQQIGDIKLRIQPAFRSRHQLLVAGSHDYPLTLLTVPGQVHLDIMRIIVFAVLTKNTLRLRRVLDIVVPEADARTRRIDPGSENAARVYFILIGENIRGRSLWVTRSR